MEKLLTLILLICITTAVSANTLDIECRTKPFGKSFHKFIKQIKIDNTDKAKDFRLLYLQLNDAPWWKI